MNGANGFADLAKHLLYETLGLLIPGATFVAALVIAAGPDAQHHALSFASGHPGLAVFGTYVIGYVVQGISRPITTLAERILQSPAMLLRSVGRLTLRSHYSKCERLATHVESTLLQRHSHTHGTTVETAPSFEALLREHWTVRLGLRDAEELTTQQVTDLSFSAILPEREHLDRFRAAASLARGVAVAVIAALALIIARLAQHPYTLSWFLAGITVALVVALYGLLERADMYDRTWKAVVPTQALATLTAAQPLQRHLKSVHRAPVAPPAAEPRGIHTPGHNGAGHVPHPVEAASADRNHGRKEKANN